MTKNQTSRQRRGSFVVNLAAMMVAGAALSWYGLGTRAQEYANEAVPVEAPVSAAAPADLERAFWSCDYAGTTGSVDSGTAIACSTITEELKNRNFNGDYDAMLAWWRANKPAEHRALEAASRANAAAGKVTPAAL